MAGETGRDFRRCAFQFKWKLSKVLNLFFVDLIVLGVLSRVVVRRVVEVYLTGMHTDFFYICISNIYTRCIYILLHIYTSADQSYRAPFLAAFFVLASSSFKFEFLAPDRLPSPSKRSSPSEPTAGFVTVLHVHRSRNSGSRVPSSASTILSPRTGKNLYPCPLPPVARKRPSHSGW